MWQFLKDLILRIFPSRFKQTDKEIRESMVDVEEFQDITKENLTAIISNSLSVLAFGDSTISVSVEDGEPTERTKLLDEIAQRYWKNIKQNIAIGNGCGMIASIPYCIDAGGKRKIYIDTITKDRIFITGVQGDDITKVTVISDFIQTNTERYYRFTDYSIENNTYIIRQKAARETKEVPLTDVADWKDINPEIRISNVDRLPIGIYRCPTSSRRPKSLTGVPITYGCEATMEKIHNCLEDIEKEYENKKIKIFADSVLFDKDKKLSKDLYQTVQGGGSIDDKSPITIFDPAFRDTAYFNKLMQYFAILEKEVGVSRGILTDLMTSGATATEIKRATYSTFALCDDIHANTESYFNDLIYGINVLANAYNLTPESDYKINYNWSYSLIEDTEQTWSMKLQAAAQGAESKAELRQFNHPEETLEESQKVIDEIAKNEPSLKTLVGVE